VRANPSGRRSPNEVTRKHPRGNFILYLASREKDNASILSALSLPFILSSSSVLIFLVNNHPLVLKECKLRAILTIVDEDELRVIIML